MGPLGNGSKCNTCRVVPENREVSRGNGGARGITWCRIVSHCVASAVRAAGFVPCLRQGLPMSTAEAAVGGTGTAVPVVCH